MAAAVPLFTFYFTSGLTRKDVELLRECTGMRLRGIENPWEDTPGMTSIAHKTVSMLLSRLDKEEEWSIDAFTHNFDQVPWDEVKQMVQKIKEVLPQITPNWEIKQLHPNLTDNP